jgi:hypothetical protein
MLKTPWKWFLRHVNDSVVLQRFIAVVGQDQIGENMEKKENTSATIEKY